ncbi:hypothetical protein, partial [Ruminococcus callidus]
DNDVQLQNKNMTNSLERASNLWYNDNRFKVLEGEHSTAGNVKFQYAAASRFCPNTVRKAT